MPNITIEDPLLESFTTNLNQFINSKSKNEYTDQQINDAIEELQNEEFKDNYINQLKEELSSREVKDTLEIIIEEQQNVLDKQEVVIENDLKKTNYSLILILVLIVIILLITQLMVIVFWIWIICMVVTLPFAIINEKKIGKFKFSRFAQNTAIGPVFIYKYMKK